MTKKRYTAESKAQAVELVRPGKAVPVVAQELGIAKEISTDESVRKGSRSRSGDEKPAADELLRLRRENAQLKLENDILNKAAVLLGTKPLPHSSDDYGNR